MTSQVPSSSMLLRRKEALAAGASDSQLRRARGSGALTAITPGVYLRGPDALDLDQATRHRALLSAVVPRLRGDPVVSHLSAAILHGLPIAAGQLLLVHVTRAGSAKSRRGPGVVGHRANLAESEVAAFGDLAVTTVDRTVLDCVLVLPHEEAIVLTGAALCRGQVTADELTAQLRRHARVPGVRAAGLIVRFVVGRSATGQP